MSSPVQHRTLHIAEVFGHICDVADHKTLAVLARTCRAFQEPALQALWRCLSDIGPLLKLFPADVWTIQGGIMKFARLPLPHEWAAFLKYAKLVRALSPYSHWSVPRQSLKTHSSVIVSLCTLRPTLVLFPNLRTLDWPTMGLKESYFPSMLSLVGDEVTTLRIKAWDSSSISDQTLQGSIGLIASKFRYLRTLQISCIPNDEHVVTAATSAAVSALVSGLHSLIVFTCPDIPVSPSSIMHLAALRQLQVVNIRLPDAPDASSWRPSGLAFQPRPFAGLTKIFLATTMSAYISFSKAVALPLIQELVLEVVGDPAAQLISQFFAAIRRQFSPLSLRDLRIRPHGEPDEARAQLNAAVVRSADLLPLLEFSLMKNFDLTMYCHHAFDDAFILDLAKAWPQLEVFLLGDENPCVHDTLPTLTALAHLARYATNLYEVGLRFDAASWTEGPNSGYPGPAEHLYGDLQGKASTASSLHVMHVTRSPIARPESVALFLARIFPTWDPHHQLSLGAFDNEEESKRWEEVQRYLPMFACIRDDERLRMEEESADDDEDEEASEASSPLGEPSGIDVNADGPQVQGNSDGDTTMIIDTDVITWSYNSW